MKVLVLNNAAPFIRGGAEELADNLVRHLNAVPGVESELLRLPFKWEPNEQLIDEVLIHRQLRLWNADRVIGLKFPAYLIPHPEKILWVLHQFRQAYDLGDAGQGLGATGRDGEIRDVIRTADNQCFAEARAIWVNSPVTQARMQRFNGVASKVLYPPLNDGELFTGGEPSDFVFAGGRVGPGKRQHLLIEAMAKAPGSGRLVVAGPPDSASYAAELEALIETLGLQGRVELRLGYHPRGQIAQWVNGARACAYLPFDEDSLGYVTMEAFAAGKAVLTTLDSGGLLEMVNDETGLVTEPTVQALADGLTQLFENPARTAEKGRAAKSSWDQRRLTWTATIDCLLS